jgi:hypothetical protein
VTLLSVLRTWPRRRWTAAAAGAVATALAVGVPTRLVPNPVFARMTPVTWWAWPVWVATAVLGGLLLATYVRRPVDETGAATNSATRAAGVGGLLSVFAVGCPVCNKLVVLALGMTGALKIFAPVQPVLGLASLALLAWSLRIRIRGDIACSVPAAVAPAGRT